MKSKQRLKKCKAAVVAFNETIEKLLVQKREKLEKNRLSAKTNGIIFCLDHIYDGNHHHRGKRLSVV